MFLLIGAIFYLAALYMLSALFYFWSRLMVSEVNLSFFTPCLLNNASARLFILGDEAISALIEALESQESVLARAARRRRHRRKRWLEAGGGRRNCM